MNSPVNYNDIRNSSPQFRRRPGRKKKLRAWQSLLFFIAVMAVLLLFGGMLYYLTDSMYLESFVQQIFFLVSSVVFVLLLRCDPKEVFPLKKPRISALAGMLVLLFASILSAEVFSLLALHFAPGSLEQAAESVDEVLRGPSFPADFLLACICPAICEEALHRGVILNGFRNSFRDRRIPVIAGGLLFGMFHIYPVRMIMPAFIGCLMCWLVLRTDNMLYSSLLHLGYNTVLITLSRIPGAGENVSGDAVLSSGIIGMSVITAGICIPFLLYIGMWLVRRVYEPRRPSFIPEHHVASVLLRILIPTAAILAVGLLMFFGIL